MNNNNFFTSCTVLTFGKSGVFASCGNCFVYNFNVTECFSFGVTASVFTGFGSNTVCFSHIVTKRRNFNVGAVIAT